MVETPPRRRASSLFFLSHSYWPVGLDPLKTGLCPVTSLEAEPSTGTDRCRQDRVATARERLERVIEHPGDKAAADT